MSFPAAACAARVNREQVRKTVSAIFVFILLAGLSLSCGSGKLPAFQSAQNAYVTLPTENSVLTLHINGLTGVITRESQTPQVTGTAPRGLALLSNKFLYVANSQSNAIAIYKVASDGTLTLSGTPTADGGTGPYSVAIDTSGKYLFVTNAFSANISVFSIDSGSGALTAVAGSPFYANDESRGDSHSPRHQFPLRHQRAHRDGHRLHLLQFHRSPYFYPRLTLCLRSGRQRSGRQ